MTRNHRWVWSTNVNNKGYAVENEGEWSYSLE